MLVVWQKSQLLHIEKYSNKNTADTEYTKRRSRKRCNRKRGRYNTIETTSAGMHGVQLNTFLKAESW